MLSLQIILFQFFFFCEILGVNKDKIIDIFINNCFFRLLGYNKREMFVLKFDLDYYLEGGFKSDILNCEEIIVKVLDKLENYYIFLCKELQERGYVEIEYFNSEECIKEIIIVNDYEFLFNGKMY